MEMYVQQGDSRMDCELKIARKYKRPFQILSEKDIRIGGILGGLFSKPGVQVEFYFTPQKTHSAPMYINNQNAGGYHNSVPSSWYAQETRRQYDPASAQGQASRGRLAESTLLEEEKRKVLAVAGDRLQSAGTGGKDASQQFLDALKELKDIVGSVKSGAKEEHPAFAHVTELLKLNDFSEKYINMMLERLRKEMVLEKLNDLDVVREQLLYWIGESIGVYKDEAAPGQAVSQQTVTQQAVMRNPRVMVLIGPTGVGKTTTISKLAAIYSIGNDDVPAIDVRMITIDAFRIGAKDQLEQIGNIMRIPVSCVDNRQDLRKEIALYGDDADLVLIDTIGKSPKDASKLGEMKEILDGAGRLAEFHLVIGAGTKTTDIESILRQFEPFNYKYVILSKMDETERIGNIISALYDKQKRVSYITDGQRVPADIRRATVVHFLINLEGFKINRDKIEERFPSGGADQFKWK